MGYPDFVCMGFQKCGTTTLFDLLRKHPQIALCRDVKEPMYYRVPIMSTIGGGSYFYRKRYFGHIKPGDQRLKGEVNAGLTFTNCAKKICRNMPRDTKMIFMMRNPVDRSYSAYKYFLARGFLPARAVDYDAKHGHAEGFDHYVHSVLDHPARRGQIMKKRMKYLVLSQSNYATCISEYLDTFDIHNMKFVIFEEFVRDEHKACLELYDFLGIDDAAGIDYHVKDNEGNRRTVSAMRAKQLYIAKGCNYFFYDLCCMTHWAPKLFARFRSYYREIYTKCLVPDTDTSQVMPKTRAYLMEYYEPEIRGIEKICGRNLSRIWNCPAAQNQE